MAETFKIDGTEYEVPSLDSLTIGERRVLYQQTKLVQEDFALHEGETEEERQARTMELTRHPDFLPALMTIAYRREHRDQTFAEVLEMMDDVNFLDAMNVDVEEEDGELPPASTSELDESSPRNSLDSNAKDGSRSENGTDEQAETLAPTGTID